MIIYIHGFGSSARSTKAEKIQNMPLNEPFLALSLSTIPHLAMKTLEDIIQLYIHSCDTELSSLKLIGSSLGGFYALYLSQKYNIKAVLINPALEITPTLSTPKKMINYYDESYFEWSQKHIDSLKEYETNDIVYAHNILLLTQKNDEVLDYNIAVKKLKHSKQIIYDNSDHGFSNIEICFHEIEQFFHT